MRQDDVIAEVPFSPWVLHLELLEQARQEVVQSHEVRKCVNGVKGRCEQVPSTSNPKLVGDVEQVRARISNKIDFDDINFRLVSLKVTLSELKRDFEDTPLGLKLWLEYLSKEAEDLVHDVETLSQDLHTSPSSRVLCVIDDCAQSAASKLELERRIVPFRIRNKSLIERHLSGL